MKAEKTFRIYSVYLETLSDCAYGSMDCERFVNEGFYQLRS